MVHIRGIFRQQNAVPQIALSGVKRIRVPPAASDCLALSPACNFSEASGHASGARQIGKIHQVLTPEPAYPANMGGQNTQQSGDLHGKHRTLLFLLRRAIR